MTKLVAKIRVLKLEKTNVSNSYTGPIFQAVPKDDVPESAVDKEPVAKVKYITSFEYKIEYNCNQYGEDEKMNERKYEHYVQIGIKAFTKAFKNNFPVSGHKM